MAQLLLNGTTVTKIATANVTRGGEVQIAPNLYGIAQDDASSGAKVALETQGVFTFTADVAVSAGAAVYLASAGHVNVTSADGTKIGVAVDAVTSGGVVKVILNA